jgi:hypothetical protein
MLQFSPRIYFNCYDDRYDLKYLEIKLGESKMIGAMKRRI